MKIIEITGVPGSGKTYLTQSLKNQLPNNWCIYSDEYIAYHGFGGRRIGQALAIFGLLLATIKKPLFYFQLFKYFLFKIYNMHYPIKIKFYLLANIILKLGRFEYVCQFFKQKEGVIFDEGLTHLPFNLVSYTNYQSTEYENIEKLFDYLRNLINKIDLIIIQGDNEKIKQRLCTRGHKRLGHSYECDWNRFIQINSEVETILLQCSHELTHSVVVLPSKTHSSEAFIATVMGFIHGK